jgi:hypothetical protein
MDETREIFRLHVYLQKNPQAIYQDIKFIKIAWSQSYDRDLQLQRCTNLQRNVQPSEF